MNQVIRQTRLHSTGHPHQIEKKTALELNLAQVQVPQALRRRLRRFCQV